MYYYDTIYFLYFVSTHGLFSYSIKSRAEGRSHYGPNKYFYWAVRSVRS